MSVTIQIHCSTLRRPGKKEPEFPYIEKLVQKGCEGRAGQRTDHAEKKNHRVLSKNLFPPLFLLSPFLPLEGMLWSVQVNEHLQRGKKPHPSYKQGD